MYTYAMKINRMTKMKNNNIILYIHIQYITINTTY